MISMKLIEKAAARLPTGLVKTVARGVGRVTRPAAKGVKPGAPSQVDDFIKWLSAMAERDPGSISAQALRSPKYSQGVLDMLAKARTGGKAALGVVDDPVAALGKNIARVKAGSAGYIKGFVARCKEATDRLAIQKQSALQKVTDPTPDPGALQIAATDPKNRWKAALPVKPVGPTLEPKTSGDNAYAIGFEAKCAELGIDAEELLSKVSGCSSHKAKKDVKKKKKKK